MSALMAFDHVSFRYPRARANALDDVSFQLAAGTSLGIVGESGSGKTTILQILLGLRAATAGTMLFDGTPLDPRSRRQMRAVRRRVQPVFQDPYSSLDPRQRVGHIVAEPVTSLGLERGRTQVEARARAALSDVGLDADAGDRYPAEFSGGQRQRIAIARALVTGPEVLVADEPVSALDVATRIEVLELLRRLQATRGLTVVMVSHDISAVAALCPETLVLKDGHVVEHGPTLELVREPREAYTRRLIDAIPRLPSEVT